MLGLLQWCRRIDHSHAEKASSKANKEDKFFNSYRSKIPAENALVAFVKGQNNQLDFVGKAISQVGYPRWNKTMDGSGSSTA